MKFSIKKALCITMMWLLLMPLGKGISVYAANTADSPFDFSLAVANTSPMFTEYRVKTNRTSVYVYPMTLTGATKVGVSIRGKKDNGALGDVTAANYYYTSPRQYRVDNYAYENGYSSVALGIQAIWGNGSTTGVWSPDCANQSSYPQMPH